MELEFKSPEGEHKENLLKIQRYEKARLNGVRWAVNNSAIKQNKSYASNNAAELNLVLAPNGESPLAQSTSFVVVSFGGCDRKENHYHR